MALPEHEAPTGTVGLLPAEESPGARAFNIARGILVESVLFVVLTVLLPLLLLAGALVDLVLWLRTRKPWMGVRLVLMGWWFLLGEVRGWLGLTIAWLIAGGPFGGDSPRRRRHVWYMQRTWMAGHLLGVRTLFGLRFEVEGDELVEPGPLLILVRHASIIDNTLPAVFVSGPHGMFLRYVIKHELKVLPTLDMGARWVPTCVVRRASADPAGEIARVRTLATHLHGADEGALIFPEGTRHTPAKLARAQEKIRESDPATADLADRLHHLLPPRLGGPLALLDAGTEADVLVFGHVGLDGFEKVSDIWSGDLVGTTVQIRFWRHARASVPDGERARIAWLYACWQELDDWIGEQRERDGAGEPADAVGAPGREPDLPGVTGPGKRRAPGTASDTDELAALRADARHAREKLDLYRAKRYGPRETSPERMRELERRAAQTRERLRFAERRTGPAVDE
ncbi:MAG: 1-acyl-sn-glycerol-3-phosphate acyltransferase [Actinomycetota bacterium]|nr:1-acyl-sn-glycerol-3-phosphate acyltransferase [Actinomycetota bacterium]